MPKHKNMNSELSQVCACLKRLINCSHSHNDLPNRIRIEGGQRPNSQQHLAELYGIQDEYELDGLTIQINQEAVDSRDFERQITNGEPIRTWQILISKKLVLDRLLSIPNIATVWFLTTKGFDEWLKNLNPFSGSTKLLREKPATQVIVYEIAHAFGGPRIAIDDIARDRIPSNWPQTYYGPSENSIKRQVHVLADEGIALDPAPFILSWGSIDSATATRFRQLSGEVLAACLAQEFYCRSRVVIKGARHLELPLSHEFDTVPTANELSSIGKAVDWIYEERSEVRAGLIADRLTLDLVSDQSLLDGAVNYIDDSLKQSIEQYKFVISERKDAYAKELRDLLKDVQQQASLFSHKIRLILNGLLRDVLAALLLISLGLFSRIGRTEQVLASKEADLMLKALAVYLIISLILQLFVHLRDLYLSREELKYWTGATRSHLGMEDIEKHLMVPIKTRRSSFNMIVIILSIVYLITAWLAWNFQCIAQILGILP